MLAKITEINYPKITLEKDGKAKEYEVEEFVKESFIKIGLAEITFHDETKKISFIKMQPTTDPYKPSEKKKGIGDIVDFDTLLKKAHELGKDFSIKTECLKLNLGEKFAMFKAVVIVSDGSVIQEYEAHGDSTKENVTGDFIKPHFIRMAETRAIVRALRWYTNNADKCAEEEK